MRLPVTDAWFSIVSAERVLSAEGGNAPVGDGTAIDSTVALGRSKPC
jgi:hypothetical protein